MDEVEAIQRMKQGDIAGLDMIVQQYQERALRAAYLITQDAQAAEDVVQEVFLRIYLRIGQFDERRPLAPWLLRSVCNQALKVAQRDSRQVSMDMEAQAALEFLESPEAALESTEQVARVRQAIRSLPARQRAAIVGRYYLGLTVQEMAQQTDSPAGTVKWLLSEARHSLRSALDGLRK